MPPKRRRHGAAEVANSSPQPQRSSSHGESDRRGTDDGESDETLPPLFNTTYAIHRVSPLYVGSEALSEARLEQLSRRLRDVLVGDVVRGVQISHESAATAGLQVGALEAVTMRWFSAKAILGDDVAGGDGAQTWEELPAHQKRGLWIQIRHENASYVAVLLPGYAKEEGSRESRGGWAMLPNLASQPTNVGSTADSHFLHLPLLLLRMPRPLQTVVCDWLSVTFDCRAGKMTLGTRTIVGVWEKWLQTAGLPTKGPDVSITLTFNAPLADEEEASKQASDEEVDDEEHVSTAGLRSITVTIATQDLARFVKAGEAFLGESQPRPARPWDSDAREQRRLAGGAADEGWRWHRGDGNRNDKGDAPECPFTEAMARYLDQQLGLDMFHPSVRVAQISCGGFVLAQSRVKVVRSGDGVSGALSRAAWMFVMELGRRARGERPGAVF